MGQDRRFRGEHDGCERPFDWLTPARQRGMREQDARALYEEAQRQARAHREPRRHEEAIYLALLQDASTRAARPSPGKITRTMRIEAERAGKQRSARLSSHTGKPIAPGKQSLTSYLMPRAARAADASRTPGAEEETRAALPGALHRELAASLGGRDSERDAGGREVLAGLLACTGGRPLPAPVRAAMEQRFGTSLAEVRLHTDASETAPLLMLGESVVVVGWHIFMWQHDFERDAAEGMPRLSQEIGRVVAWHAAQPGADTEAAPGSETDEVSDDIPDSGPEAVPEPAVPVPHLAEGSARHRRPVRRRGRNHARPRRTRSDRGRMPSSAHEREVAARPMQLARARGTAVLPGQRWSETAARQTTQALDVLRDTLARVTGNEDALAGLLTQTGVGPLPGRSDDTGPGRERMAAQALALARAGAARPLPYREAMEARFGVDLGQVQCFAGPAAALACRALGAAAFTVKNVVVLGADHPSEELIAHELAHVIQQGGHLPGGALAGSPTTLPMTGREDQAEREADQVSAPGHAAGLDAHAAGPGGSALGPGTEPGTAIDQARALTRHLDRAGGQGQGGLTPMGAALARLVNVNGTQPQVLGEILAPVMARGAGAGLLGQNTAMQSRIAQQNTSSRSMLDRATAFPMQGMGAGMSMMAMSGGSFGIPDPAGFAQSLMPTGDNFVAQTISVIQGICQSTLMVLDLFMSTVGMLVDVVEMLAMVLEGMGMIMQVIAAVLFALASALMSNPFTAAMGAALQSIAMAVQSAAMNVQSVASSVSRFIQPLARVVDQVGQIQMMVQTVSEVCAMIQMAVDVFQWLTADTAEERDAAAQGIMQGVGAVFGFLGSVQAGQFTGFPSAMAAGTLPGLGSGLAGAGMQDGREDRDGARQDDARGGNQREGGSRGSQGEHGQEGAGAGRSGGQGDRDALVASGRERASDDAAARFAGHDGAKAGAGRGRTGAGPDGGRADEARARRDDRGGQRDGQARAITSEQVREDARARASEQGRNHQHGAGGERGNRERRARVADAGSPQSDIGRGNGERRGQVPVRLSAPSERGQVASGGARCGGAMGAPYPAGVSAALDTLNRLYQQKQQAATQEMEGQRRVTEANALAANAQNTRTSMTDTRRVAAQQKAVAQRDLQGQRQGMGFMARIQTRATRLQTQLRAKMGQSTGITQSTGMAGASAQGSSAGAGSQAAAGGSQGSQVLQIVSAVSTAVLGAIMGQLTGGMGANGATAGMLPGPMAMVGGLMGQFGGMAAATQSQAAAKSGEAGMASRILGQASMIDLTAMTQSDENAGMAAGIMGVAQQTLGSAMTARRQGTGQVQQARALEQRVDSQIASTEAQVRTEIQNAAPLRNRVAPPLISGPGGAATSGMLASGAGMSASGGGAHGRRDASDDRPEASAGAGRAGGQARNGGRGGQNGKPGKDGKDDRHAGQGGTKSGERGKREQQRARRSSARRRQDEQRDRARAAAARNSTGTRERGLRDHGKDTAAPRSQPGTRPEHARDAADAPAKIATQGAAPSARAPRDQGPQAAQAPGGHGANVRPETGRPAGMPTSPSTGAAPAGLGRTSDTPASAFGGAGGGLANQASMMTGMGTGAGMLGGAGSMSGVSESDAGTEGAQSSAGPVATGAPPEDQSAVTGADSTGADVDGTGKSTGPGNDALGGQPHTEADGRAATAARVQSASEPERQEPREGASERMAGRNEDSRQQQEDGKRKGKADEHEHERKGDEKRKEKDEDGKKRKEKDEDGKKRKDKDEDGKKRKDKDEDGKKHKEKDAHGTDKQQGEGGTGGGHGDGDADHASADGDAGHASGSALDAAAAMAAGMPGAGMGPGLGGVGGPGAGMPGAGRGMQPAGARASVPAPASAPAPTAAPAVGPTRGPGAPGSEFVTVRDLAPDRRALAAQAGSGSSAASERPAASAASSSDAQAGLEARRRQELGAAQQARANLPATQAMNNAPDRQGAPGAARAAAPGTTSSRPTTGARPMPSAGGARGPGVRSALIVGDAPARAGTAIAAALPTQIQAGAATGRGTRRGSNPAGSGTGRRAASPARRSGGARPRPTRGSAGRSRSRPQSRGVSRGSGRAGAVGRGAAGARPALPRLPISTVTPERASARTAAQAGADPQAQARYQQTATQARAIAQRHVAEENGQVGGIQQRIAQVLAGLGAELARIDGVHDQRVSQAEQSRDQAGASAIQRADAQATQARTQAEHAAQARLAAGRQAADQQLDQGAQQAQAAQREGTAQLGQVRQEVTQKAPALWGWHAREQQAFEDSAQRAGGAIATRTRQRADQAERTAEAAAAQDLGAARAGADAQLAGSADRIDAAYAQGSAQLEQHATTAGQQIAAADQQARAQRTQTTQTTAQQAMAELERARALVESLAARTRQELTRLWDELDGVIPGAQAGARAIPELRFAAGTIQHVLALATTGRAPAVLLDGAPLDVALQRLARTMGPSGGPGASGASGGRASADVPRLLALVREVERLAAQALGPGAGTAGASGVAGPATTSSARPAARPVANPATRPAAPASAPRPGAGNAATAAGPGAATSSPAAAAIQRHLQTIKNGLMTVVRVPGVLTDRPGGARGTGGPVQRKRDNQGHASGPGAEARASGAGEPLPEPVRADMEQSLGTDFSAVRIHHDASAGALEARAYTRGTDIHFAPGEYDPHSAAGRAVLGHELVHVEQQRAGRVQATAQVTGVPLNDAPALEAEADRLGERAARGLPATVPGSAGVASAPAAPGTPVQRMLSLFGSGKKKDKSPQNPNPGQETASHSTPPGGNGGSSLPATSPPSLPQSTGAGKQPPPGGMRLPGIGTLVELRQTNTAAGGPPRPGDAKQPPSGPLSPRVPGNETTGQPPVVSSGAPNRPVRPPRPGEAQQSGDTTAPAGPNRPVRPPRPGEAQQGGMATSQSLTGQMQQRPQAGPAPGLSARPVGPLFRPWDDPRDERYRLPSLHLSETGTNPPRFSPALEARLGDIWREHQARQAEARPPLTADDIAEGYLVHSPEKAKRPPADPYADKLRGMGLRAQYRDEDGENDFYKAGENGRPKQRIYVNANPQHVVAVMGALKDAYASGKPAMTTHPDIHHFKGAGAKIASTRTDTIVIYVKTPNGFNDVLKKLRELDPRMFFPEISPATQSLDDLPGVGWANEPQASQPEYNAKLKEFQDRQKAQMGPAFSRHYEDLPNQNFQPSFHQFHGYAYLGALRRAKDEDDFLRIAASNLWSAGIDPANPHLAGPLRGSDWVSGVVESRFDSGYAVGQKNASYYGEQAGYAQEANTAVDAAAIRRHYDQPGNQGLAMSARHFEPQRDDRLEFGRSCGMRFAMNDFVKGYLDALGDEVPLASALHEPNRSK
jgi:hypothetical protein